MIKIVAILVLTVTLAEAVNAAERLTVWHGQKSPASVQFFRDFNGDQQFRQSITSRYELWVVDLDQCSGACRRVPVVPFFAFGPQTIAGYHGKQWLLKQLMVKEWHPARTTPAEPPPPIGIIREPIVDLGDPAEFPQQSLPSLPPPERRQRKKPATKTQTPVRQESAPLPPRLVAGGSFARWFGAAFTIFNLTHPTGQAATMLSLATGVAGWMISKRRQRRSSGVRPVTPSKAFTVTADDGGKTETRYVQVPVADPVGEAYKEACRRVASLSPKDTPIVNTIEHTAKQILHGQRVLHGEKSPRDAHARPGLFWED